MKTFKKGILALGLTLGIIASVGSGSVFAKSYATAYVHGAYVSGESFISYSVASAQTLSRTVGLVIVNSKYCYINTRTFKTDSQIKSAGDVRKTSAKVSFTAPIHTKSIVITSSHKVSSYGETWIANTANEYKG